MLEVKVLEEGGNMTLEYLLYKRQRNKLIRIALINYLKDTGNYLRIY